MFENSRSIIIETLAFLHCSTTKVQNYKKITGVKKGERNDELTLK
jgi:hypothetical protein